MENKLVLKIAIIIIAFLLVFAIFLIIVVRDLSSNQLSYERANMVVTQPDTNNENETIAVRNETEEIEADTKEIETIPHTRGRDIIKPYITPFAIATSII